MLDSDLHLLGENEQLQNLILREDGDKEGGDDPENGEGGKKKDPPEPKEKDEKLIPQSQVDKLVGDTRKRARETAENKMLERFGVKTEAELLASLEEGKTLKESQMSEAEKADARIKELEADSSLATELQKQNEELGEVVQKTLDARIKQLDPPDYLKTIMEDMEPAKALSFLSEHEDELADQKPRVPKTDADGKGVKKALTEKDKAARKEELARRYNIT